MTQILHVFLAYVAPLNSQTFIYSKGDRPHKLYAQIHTLCGECPELDLHLVTRYPDCQSILPDTNRHQCHLLCFSYLLSILQICVTPCLSQTFTAVPSPQLSYFDRKAQILGRGLQTDYFTLSKSSINHVFNK